jgi:hypothetical protein
VAAVRRTSRFNNVAGKFLFICVLDLIIFYEILGSKYRSGELIAKLLILITFFHLPEDVVVDSTLPNNGT